MCVSSIIVNNSLEKIA